MWCVTDDNNYMCNICAQGFFRFERHKLSTFHEKGPNFTYSQESYF